MAEDAHHQGWGVPQRTPAIVAASVIGMMLVVLLIAGTIYKHTLAPNRYRPPTTFPAPGVEVLIHDGQGDPQRGHPAPRQDVAVEAAKQAVAAQGIAGWHR